MEVPDSMNIGTGMIITMMMMIYTHIAHTNQINGSNVGDGLDDNDWFYLTGNEWNFDDVDTNCYEDCNDGSWLDA